MLFSTRFMVYGLVLGNMLAVFGVDDNLLIIGWAIVMYPLILFLDRKYIQNPNPLYKER